MRVTRRRPRVGDVEIDAAIALLERIDDLSNDQFHRVITLSEYREMVSQLIAGMSDTATQMFAAVYVDSEGSEDHLKNFYEKLEQQGEARRKRKMS